MKKILKRLKKDPLDSVGNLLAILVFFFAFGAGIYNYHFKPAKPSYTFSEPATIISEKNHLSSLKIFWEDTRHPIDNLYSIKILIWNKGVDPVQIDANSNLKIVGPKNEVVIREARIIRTSLKVGFTVSINDDYRNTHRVKLDVASRFALKNHNGILVEVFYSSENGGSEVPKWDFKGASKNNADKSDNNFREYENWSSATATLTGWERWITIGIISILLLGNSWLASSGALTLSRCQEGEEKNSHAFKTSIGLLFVALILFLTFYGSLGDIFDGVPLNDKELFFPFLLEES